MKRAEFARHYSSESYFTKAWKHILILAILAIDTEAWANNDAPVEAPKLSKSDGLLVLSLEIEGVQASIKYRRITTVESQPIRKIILKSDKSNFFIEPLPKGQYQITSVNIPFFDLPYVVDTSEDPRYQFTIKPLAFNYVGHLFINKERSSKSVDVRLLNRIASNKATIEEVYHNILEQYQLVDGSGVIGNFLQEYRKKR